MLTRLLETAANAADAAQSGSNGADLTQLTNILDWVMIVLLPAVALYLFYTVFRLRRDRVLFDNKLLYPGGCTKDDCRDPDGFIDYILPRLIIIGAAFLLCGAFTALVVFIPAMDTLVCNILEIVFPIGHCMVFVCQPSCRARILGGVSHENCHSRCLCRQSRRPELG